jgi:hypothetical protein
VHEFPFGRVVILEGPLSDEQRCRRSGSFPARRNLIGAQCIITQPTMTDASGPCYGIVGCPNRYGGCCYTVIAYISQ